MRTWSLRTSACGLTAVAVILWGTIIAGMWVTIPERGMRAIVPAAVVAPIIAAMLWVTRGNRRRQDGHSLVIRALADVTRPAAARVTGPLRRVK